MIRRAPVLAIIVPSEAEIIGAACLAAASHLVLSTDGRRTVIAPIVPRGFSRLPVVRKAVEPKGAA